MNEGYLAFVENARKYACGIYKTVPGALVPSVYDAGYKKIWDDLCYEAPPSELPGLPEPPTAPFTGGQCCNLGYKVNLRFSTNGGTSYQEVLLPGVYNGKILGIFEVRRPDGSGGIAIQYQLRWEDCDKVVSSEVVGQAPSEYPTIMTIKNVYPAYSASDNCGNPPKKFPDAPPVPDGGYKSPPVPIPDNDGEVNNYIFNFYPPKPEDYVKNPLPPVTVNVDGVNVNLNFDIDFNFGGGVDVNPPRNPPSPLPPNFDNRFDDLTRNVDNIQDRVDSIGRQIDCSFNPPNFIDAPDVDKEEDEVDGGGKEEGDKPGLLGVLVELTTPPSDVQFGTPNVNFAGWFTFLVQGGYAPRNPIAFDKGIFLAPEGATGYALTFTKGAKGRITVFSKSSEN